MSTITLKIDGMTCNHCASHVTEELTELAGVEGVDVALNPQGTSDVVVTTSASVSDEELRAAVDEAGNYTVVDVIR
ncbi:heavy-metal-associated domain-containing protein [Trueperella pecoris]|uniref:Heavy-metal-associated domain-containing protein n=1 Tax=Trueperella pecoris TaxID=2733571 RepID=A0A7M1R159_9ACTO|nr:heavy-metal-associated domain-containing protein [Trueperella pecoris]QOR47868.1 heavy-metal-associated domain-containing protein [Trueperella pecoris]